MRILGWILFIVVIYGFWNLGVWWEARVSLIDGEVFLNIVKLIFTFVFALIGLYIALRIIVKFDLLSKNKN
jgi:hypothetical protein